MVAKNKPRLLNLAVQEGILLKAFPESRARTKNSALRWTCSVTPTPLSKTYKLQVRYKLGKAPEVFVLLPKLEKRNGKRPPHLYSFDKAKLCLYMPSIDEWDGSMRIVDTLVPWAVEWLIHYEIWLACDIWCGEGHHPKIDEDLKNDQLNSAHKVAC